MNQAPAQEASTAVAALQAEELGFLRLLSANLTERTMIDVGAHHGLTLEPFLAAGFQAHAFEPVEENRALIHERFGDRPGLAIWSEAVSRSVGEGRLHLATRLDGSLHDHYHSLEAIATDAHHQKGDVIAVPTVSLDSLVSNGSLPRSVGLLKIDTEGHDLAVLQGAASLACEVISVEFWGSRHPLGPSPSPAQRMVDLMAERGYGSFVAIEHAHGSPKFHVSSLDGIGDANWGNIFFLHDSAEGPRREALRWCQRGGEQGLTPLQRLLLRAFPGRSDLRFYDVGAFHGDFSAEVLDLFPRATGILFEPSDESATLLEERLGADARLEVRRLALADAEGVQSFHVVADAPATNSLLRPQPGSSAVAEQRVLVSTLDHIQSAERDPAVDLIKVDTQGSDLAVLRGARRTLATHGPLVMTEAIFVPLYERQASATEILSFLQGLGYRLIRVLNVHHTSTDELAFADLLLTRSPPDPTMEPFILWSADDTARLRNEVRLLRGDRRAKRETILRLRSQRDQLRVALNESKRRHPEGVKALESPRTEG